MIMVGVCDDVAYFSPQRRREHREDLFNQLGDTDRLKSISPSVIYTTFLRTGGFQYKSACPVKVTMVIKKRMSLGLSSIDV